MRKIPQAPHGWGGCSEREAGPPQSAWAPDLQHCVPLELVQGAGAQAARSLEPDTLGGAFKEKPAALPSEKPPPQMRRDSHCSPTTCSVALLVGSPFKRTVTSSDIPDNVMVSDCAFLRVSRVLRL